MKKFIVPCAVFMALVISLLTLPSGKTLASIADSWSHGFKRTNAGSLSINVAEGLFFDGDTFTLLVANGGRKTATIAAGAGTVTISPNAGRIVSVLVTTAGTVALTCFDNASLASGTIVALTPATTVLATTYTVNNPVANGITCSDPVSGPAVTVSYN